MSIGVLTLHLHLPGVASLKEKRGRIKPVLARLHREFNVSTAEIDRQDMWQEAVLACALVSSDPDTTRRSLQTVLDFFARNWPDMEIISDKIDLV